MPTQVQVRRGTTAEHSSFTGAVGELTVDTDKDVVVIHDGSTAGGHPMLKQDGSNSALALGSASSPSLKFTGDTNTGIYSPGADQVAISTNGTGRLTVSTTAVSSTLAVDHPLGAVGTPSITFTGDLNTGFWSPTADTIAASTGGSERLRIDSSGRLGLGTSSPSTPLHVASPSSSAGINTVATFATPNNANTTSGGAILLGGFYGDGSGSRISATGNPQLSGAHDLWLQTRTTAGTLTSGLLIDATGRVGIGNNAPGSKLDITDSSATNGVVINFRNSTTGTLMEFGQPGVANWRIGQPAGADAFAIYGFGGGAYPERLRVDSSGRLLVGTSTARSNFFNTTIGAPALQFESTDAPRLSVVSSSSIAGFPAQLILSHQLSGTVGGNTAVNSSSSLGMVSFQGSDGTEFVEAARIECSTDGTPGANDMPGALLFSTCSDGSASPSERLRITQDGSVIQNYYVYDSYNAANLITGAGSYIGSNNAPGLGLAYRGGGNANAGVISFGGLSSNGNAKTLAAIIVTQDNTATNRANGYLRFYTNRDSAADASATPIERVRFTDRIFCDVTTITSLTSERRLKQDIDSVPLDPELCWSVARDLPIRSFAYKNNPESTNYGYIVDEVITVDSSLVFETGEKDDEGPIRSYDNAKLQAMYHMALKQALAKIETLEAKVAALEGA
ncbi:hypothetical protein EBT31_06865 [bacterium]|nr:hypothetical protein [bacterium]